MRRFAAVVIIGFAIAAPAPAQAPRSASAAGWQSATPVLGQPAEAIPEPVTRGPALGPSPARFSRATLEQIALANHPALAVARARIGAAEGRWVQVGLYKNPTVGYIGSDIGEAGTAGKQGAFMGQEFITAGKRQLARDVVRQEIQRLDQQFAALRYQVLSDVRRAFYEVLFAQRRRELTQQLLGLNEHTVEIVRKLLEVQEVGRVDLSRAEVAAKRTRVLDFQAANQHDAAWRNLTAVVAAPDLQPAPVDDPLPASPTTIDWETALQQLLYDSPQMAEVLVAVGRAEAALQAAIAGRYPNFQMRTGVQSDAATAETVAHVDISVPLPVFDRNQGAIAQAQSELTAARAEVSRVELRLQQRLAVVFRDYATAQQTYQQYDTEIVPEAQNVLDLVTRAYEAGEIGFVDLLTAQRTLIETSLERIDAQQQLWENIALLENFLLSGSLLPRP